MHFPVQLKNLYRHTLRHKAAKGQKYWFIAHAQTNLGIVHTHVNRLLSNRTFLLRALQKETFGIPLRNSIFIHKL